LTPDRRIIRTFIVFILVVFIVPISVYTQDKNEVKAFSYGMRLYNDGLFDMAAMQFESFIKTYSSSPNLDEAFYLIGECAFKQADYDKASQAFLEYLLNFPKGKRAAMSQYSLAECLEAENNLNGAVEAFQRLVLVYPESNLRDKALLKQALLQIRLGRIKDAESSLVRLRDLSKGNYKQKALLQLVKLYIEQKKYKEADAGINQLLAISKNEKGRSEVLMLVYDLYEKTGRVSKIIDVFNEYLYKNTTGRYIGKLWYLLGKAYYSVARNTEALTCFDKSISLAEKNRTKADALKNAGIIYLKLNNFKKAAEYLEKASDNADSPVCKNEINSLLARAYAGLSAFYKAAQTCESILDSDSLNPDIKRQCLLAGALYNAKWKNFNRAVFLYKRFSNLYPDDPLTPAVLVKSGRILSQRTKDFDGAVTCFRKVLSEYGNSTVLPEAAYLYAQTLEETSRIKEAANLYRKLQRDFPCSQWADSAEARLKNLVILSPVSYEKILIKMGILINQVLSKEADVKIFLDLASISFFTLKDYKGALSYYQRYLTEKKGGAGEDSILYRIGICYSKLSRSENRKTYEDSARSSLNRVAAKYKSSSFAKKARFALAGLEESKNPYNAFLLYKKIINLYPEDIQTAKAMLYIGERYEKDGKPDSALVFYNRVVSQFPGTPEVKKALYRAGMLSFEKRNFTVSDSSFNVFEERFPNSGEIPRVYYSHAVLFIEKGDLKGAELYLADLSKRFFYSDWSDSARWHLASVYMQKKEYEKAANICRQMLYSDSLKRVGHEFELLKNPVLPRSKIIKVLGKAYELKGDLDKARSAYEKLDINSNTENRIFYYESLAAIAEREHRFQEAVYLFMEIYKENPDSYKAARLGRLFFRLNRFDDAEKYIGIAIQSAKDDEDRIKLEADLIISLLKQGKIPQANVRIKMFTSKWKSNRDYKNYMAHFLLEKGKAYLNDKEFTLALTQFQTIKKKYKNTPFNAEAELQTGRALLITNKIEDALQLLTRMADVYKDDPIIYKIYLNLGDYYFRSSQYNIALEAFSKAVKDPEDKNISRLAMRYLIRVHDMLRMYDSGLYLVRQYIKKFPYADDILQKKVQVGTFLMKLNEYQRAIEALRKAKEVADFETQSEIQYWIGKSYESMGWFRQAIFEFLQVKYLLPRTKLPWAATALYEAGQCYVKLDEPDKAKKIFKKIVIQEGAASDLGRIAQKRIEEIEKGQNSGEQNN